MNIIQIKTTNSSVTLARNLIKDQVPYQSPTYFSRRIPFNFFYLAKGEDVLKKLMQSYEVLFELSLTRQYAIDLLSTPWDGNRGSFDSEHPVNKTIIEEFADIHAWSLYIPVYNFHISDKKFKTITYKPRFRPPAYGEEQKEMSIKVHLTKKTFPNPCFLCEKFPEHQAGECMLLDNSRTHGFQCPLNMKLHIPRRFL